MHAFRSRRTLPWGREFKTTRDLKGLNRMNDWTVETPAWRKPSNWSLEALIAENPFALFNSVFHFFDFNSDFLHSCLLWHKITISGVSSFWSRWRDAMTTGYDSSCMHVMCTVLATGL